LFAIQKLIASGEIEVGHRSLTKPKLGAKMIPARHSLAEDQAQEAQRLAKAVKAGNPFADILW
jgi:5,10-methylenetetrahydrofolate reductase